MIGVVATMKVAPGKEADFEAAFGKLAAQVQANEPGCLQYDLFRSKKDGSTFVVMERYADKAAFEAHGRSSYFLEAGPILGPLLAGAPAIEVLSKV